MVQTAIGWFPNLVFANLYGIVVLLALLSDEIVPRLAGGRGISISQGRDRGSFILIYLLSWTGLAGGVYIRYQNIGVVPAWIQGLALVLLAAGTVIREWAIALLGVYFSRIIKIEQGHRLITSGPYRWFRHPAYTGC
jgi:protein-S-isoprenylcysteine O-methyltransferase Ste14